MIAKTAIKPLVYARFWDHMSGAADDAKPIICEVFGILKSQDTLSYTICPWICEFNLEDPNTDAYCILKSVVLELRQIDLKEARNEHANEKRYRKGKETVKRDNASRIRRKQPVRV